MEQAYKGYGLDTETHQPALQTSWAEDAATLNTHNSYEPALTLDQVYAKAKNEWLKANQQEHIISFEAKNRGMISSCGFTPKNCQDDCFTGIYITDIRSVPGI